jgi:hypothetical protein
LRAGAVGDGRVPVADRLVAFVLRGLGPGDRVDHGLLGLGDAGQRAAVDGADGVEDLDEAVAEGLGDVDEFALGGAERGEGHVEAGGALGLGHLLASLAAGSALVPAVPLGPAPAGVRRQFPAAGLVSARPGLVAALYQALRLCSCPSTTNL